MFEINPNKKITSSDSIQEQNQIQQRAFLNEPQDSLELSTKKKKGKVSFCGGINNIIKTFFDNKSDAVSPKAEKMLRENDIVDKDFVPENSIATSDYNNLTDMPATFQRKLAIDMVHGEPNSKEEVYRYTHKVAEIIYNENGKPSEIKHFCLNTVDASEQFEYAQKQDGSYVLSKERIYKHKNNNEKILDEEITFHKHHNGVVTISSTDGRGMSYSLRHDTIRNYNNTPTPIEAPTKQPEPKKIVNSDGTIEEIKPRKIFIKPTPTYPKQEYTGFQKEQIERKFERIKQEFDRWHKPNDEYAFMSYTPVIRGLDTVKKLVLDAKDPIIQNAILKLLSEMKDSDLPTNYMGNYNRIDVHDHDKKFIQIYKLAKISALIDENNVTLDERNNVNSKALEDKLLFSSNDSETIEWQKRNEANKKINGIMFDETLSKPERLAEINKLMHGLKYELLANNIDMICHKQPEIQDYLINTYIKQNIPEELRDDLALVEKITGEKIIPKNYSNFLMKSLEGFHELSDMAKSHYVKHPELCNNKYLYDDDLYGMETPYKALSNLSEEEWKIFENRNIADIIDLVTGYNISSFKTKTGANIHKVIEMSDADWKKLNDFNLLNLNGRESWYKSNKYRDVKFDFDQMQSIIDNLSLDEWNRAKERGLIDMTSDTCSEYTNFGLNISTPILISATKAPESTFNFLKKINLFNDGKMIIYNRNDEKSYSDISKGIDFLAKSHNNVYQNVQKLVDNGINPSIVMTLVGICADKYNHFGQYVTNKTLELKEKGISDTELPKILTMYVDLQSIKNKSNINELSIEEKRSLLKNVIKYNTLLFENRYSNIFDSPIIPKSKEEYCSLLPKLIKSIGIDIRPVTQEVIDNFNTATKSMSDKSGEFLNTKFTKDSPKLILEYPREEFIKDIQEKTKDLSETEKIKVYDYFGFDLKPDKNGTIQMHGYPVNVNNGAKLAEIKEETTKQVVESVRPLVEKFSHENDVSIDGKPELTSQLNNIIKLFPEFRTTIGKKQHGTHDLTVDTHILKVLQGVMSDERYQNLSENDKKIINIATLLHDITKAEGLDDKTHAPYSAYDAYHILSKMNMSEKDKLKIYQIIKNHEWLADYNKKVKVNTHEYREKTVAEKKKIAKDIAFALKDDNNFELSHILTKADLKGVKETDEFYDKFAQALNDATAHIRPLIDNIQKTAIYLPQTKIPKASELKVDGENVKEVISKDKDGNEIKNKIVYLKPNMDLGSLGFEKDLNSNDLNVIVHALDYDTQSATFQALGSVDSDSLLSSSYVNYKKGNYHVFRKQGFILDVNSVDIQAGTYKDFGSGYGKDLETLKSEYMFNGKRKDVRNFMSDRIKTKMKLSDDEYKKLYGEIADKSITDLDKSHPKVAKAIREIFEEMEVKKRSYGRDYNEWLVSRPKIQGVFIEGSQYQDQSPPEFLAKYAAENDLPIIYFGE